MKKLFFLLCFLLIFTTSVAAEPPEVKAPYAILADTKNNVILYEKNINDTFQPGGLSKLMTAIVALESGMDLSQPITADPELIASCDFSFGNMGVLAKETLTANDLLGGMMIYDAAEAAELLAASHPDGRDGFVTLMNEKATAIGATNTHYTSAGGYPDENQHTTAYDQFLIAQYALQNQTLRSIMATQTYVIEPTNRYTQTRYLQNTNQFVVKSLDNYSPSTIGLKTSYIKGVGYTLSAAATRNNTTLVCIVANAPNEGGKNQAYPDVQRLMDYGFGNFRTFRLVTKGEIIDELRINNGRNTDHILLQAGTHLEGGLPIDYDPKELVRTIHKEQAKAPISEGQPVGTLTISYQGRTVGEAPLVANESVERDNVKSVTNFLSRVFLSPLFLTPLFLLLACLIGHMFFVNYKKVNR
ncbi:MAG: D-alanyl-D-alanine carboxypeptidase [Ruminococcaceae bacterium]|nr:D-alanyl-D-alanine carboxypeptidase [Oscillospiraceae bacterium]